MTAANRPASAKGHRDENFPVASALIAPCHRPVVLAFYRLARLADDIADHGALTSDEKLARLAAVEDGLLGRSDAVAEATTLRRVLAERGLTDRHILDLLEAFRRDAVKNRCADWADLMDYCRWSAAPVGRFMLDVHGEDRAAWPASDALCAALQVINHLQDCGQDYRGLGRVYVPLDALAAAGLGVEALGEGKAAPALRMVIAGLAKRTRALLTDAAPLAAQVRDPRLALEIGAIHQLAESLAAWLVERDPLSERVHHTRAEAAGLAALGAGRTLIARLVPGGWARRRARAEA